MHIRSKQCTLSFLFWPNIFFSQVIPKHLVELMCVYPHQTHYMNRQHSSIVHCLWNTIPQWKQLYRRKGICKLLLPAHSPKDTKLLGFIVLKNGWGTVARISHSHRKVFKAVGKSICYKRNKNALYWIMSKINPIEKKKLFDKKKSQRSTVWHNSLKKR